MQADFFVTADIFYAFGRCADRTCHPRPDYDLRDAERDATVREAEHVPQPSEMSRACWNARRRVIAAAQIPPNRVARRAPSTTIRPGC